MKKQYLSFADLDAVQSSGSPGPFRLDYRQTSPGHWFSGQRNLATFQDEAALADAANQLAETHAGIELIAYYRSSPGIPCAHLFRRSL